MISSEQPSASAVGASGSQCEGCAPRMRRCARARTRPPQRAEHPRRVPSAGRTRAPARQPPRGRGAGGAGRTRARRGRARQQRRGRETANRRKRRIAPKPNFDQFAAIIYAANCAKFQQVFAQFGATRAGRRTGGRPARGRAGAGAPPDKGGQTKGQATGNDARRLPLGWSGAVLRPRGCSRGDFVTVGLRPLVVHALPRMALRFPRNGL